ncbi:C4b-binding protein-like [Clavelina lepadiformis]|uniref:C4b-binding protein-like n=1 Tax=Clavelina lepadiformis TaxID=159417 RepID=UPI00404322E5
MFCRFVHLMVLLLFADISQGLVCLRCTNAPSHEQCDKSAQLQLCTGINDACATAVRTDWSGGQRITKSCKQRLACMNQQNVKYCSMPRPVNKVCFCCCDKDQCNMGNSSCTQGELGMYGDVKEELGTNVKLENTESACLPPPSILHGTTSRSNSGSLLFAKDSKVMYECEDDFALVSVMGSSVTVCKEDGAWSLPFGSLPSCRRTCPTPPSIEFGFLMPLERATPYFEGDLIVYKCNDGFEINGDFVGVCQADGSWSLAKLPFCGGVCHHPLPLERGKVSNPNPSRPYLEKDNVIYICDDGYNLIGPSVSTCQLDGQWSVTVENFPECIVGCPEPMTIDHGKVMERHPPPPHFQGDQVSYHCDEGFLLLGSNISTCLVDGSWSLRGVDLPVCKRTCPKYPMLANGQLINRKIVEPYYETEEIAFACDDGYVLNGPDSTTCQSNGDWDSQYGVPWCRRICPDPKQIAHGSFKDQHPPLPYLENEQIVYFCDDKFVLIGRNTSTCQADGTWTLSRMDTPSCEYTHCPIGIKEGKVPDKAMTASSYFYKGHEAYRARLENQKSHDHIGAWIPRRNLIGEWLQVDLGYPMKITGVMTQGRPTDIPAWITSFKISYGISPDRMQMIKRGGRDVIFAGNTDTTSKKTTVFPTPVLARYIRLVVRSWQAFIALRLEYLSC